MQTTGALALNGRIKGEYGKDAFPSFSLSHQGGRRHLPLPRPPAPRAGHLPRPRHHQSRRQRRQHRRQPEPAPPRAGTQPDRRRAGAADPALRPRRGRPGRRHPRPRRPAPHGQARQGAGAGRQHRGGRGGADPDVVGGQRPVRPGRGARHGERPRALGQVGGVPPSARHPGGLAPARAPADRAQVVQRHGRQQRPPGLRLPRQPARLRPPGRGPAGQRDGRQQPIRPGRVAQRLGRPQHHSGAGPHRLRARREGGRAALRQAHHDQRPGPAAGEGPAGHPGELRAQHPGRRDRRHRLLRTTTPGKPTFDVGLKLQKLDIPSAFEAFTTIKLLAPVAKYARATSPPTSGSTAGWART